MQKQTRNFNYVKCNVIRRTFVFAALKTHLVPKIASHREETFEIYSKATSNY